MRTHNTTTTVRVRVDLVWLGVVESPHTLQLQPYRLQATARLYIYCSINTNNIKSELICGHSILVPSQNLIGYMMCKPAINHTSAITSRAMVSIESLKTDSLAFSKNSHIPRNGETKPSISCIREEIECEGKGGTVHLSRRKTSLTPKQEIRRSQDPIKISTNTNRVPQTFEVKLPRIGKSLKNNARSVQTQRNGRMLVRRKSSATDLRLSIHTFSSQSKTKQYQAKGGNGAPSPHTSKRPTRRGKSPYIIYAIMPSNLLEEKRKFFASGYKCNPVFVYDNPADEATLTRYRTASYTLLPQAVKVMDSALAKYGCYEKFEEVTAGRRLSPHEFQERFDAYLKREKLENQVFLNMTPDLLSRALMTRSRGRSVMNIRLSILRDNWSRGVLQHEIGTHFTRAQNNRQQPWQGNKGKRKYGLLPLNPTEEGLASLHSVLGRKDPSLWRAALLYFTVYNASKLSFADLFERLGRFVQDPEVRWDYCMRAKRGQIDTSEPGCFNKDQVYLDGVLQILRYRHQIDFHSLVRLGKVSYLDVERLKKEGVLIPSTVILPSFMEDLEEYRNSLTEILLKNGLSDTDLRGIFPREMHEL